MNKKVLLALLTLPMIAACNGGGGGGTSVDNRRVLTVEFVKAGFGLTPYEKLKEAFEASHPDVKITLVPTRTMDSDAGVRISSGKASDIMIYNRTLNDIRLWAKQGLVYDFKDHINEDIGDGSTIWSSLDDNGKKACEYDGGYYVIPEYYNVNGFVYNSTVFEKMGWETPKTTTELKSLCQTIANTKFGNKSASPIVYCTEADGYLYYCDQGVAASYEGRANLDNFYKFESAEVYNPSNNVGKLRGLETLKELFYTSGYAKNIYKAEDCQNALFSLDGLMMLNGSWFENEMSVTIANQPQTQIKLFPMPEYADDQNQVVHAEGYTCPENKEGVVSAEFTASMFIPAKAKNIADAVEYLKFTSTKEACEIWTRYSNSVRPFNYDYSKTNPAYAEMSEFGKSVLDVASNYSLYVPLSNAAISVLGHAGFRPQGYWFTKLSNGEKSPSDCVSDDYTYVQENWASWQSEAQREFGN